MSKPKYAAGHRGSHHPASKERAFSGLDIASPEVVAVVANPTEDKAAALVRRLEATIAKTENTPPHFRIFDLAKLRTQYTTLREYFGHIADFDWPPREEASD